MATGVANTNIQAWIYVSRRAEGALCWMMGLRRFLDWEEIAAVGEPIVVAVVHLSLHIALLYSSITNLFFTPLSLKWQFDNITYL